MTNGLQDTIADMFTICLRNAQAVGKKNVKIIFFKIKLAIAQLLKRRRLYDPLS